jgi:hypothetical protein
MTVLNRLAWGVFLEQKNFILSIASPIPTLVFHFDSDDPRIFLINQSMHKRTTGRSGLHEQCAVRQFGRINHPIVLHCSAAI